MKRETEHNFRGLGLLASLVLAVTLSQMEP